MARLCTHCPPKTPPGDWCPIGLISHLCGFWPCLRPGPRSLHPFTAPSGSPWPSRLTVPPPFTLRGASALPVSYQPPPGATRHLPHQWLVAAGSEGRRPERGQKLWGLESTGRQKRVQRQEQQNLGTTGTRGKSGQRPRRTTGLIAQEVSFTELVSRGRSFQLRKHGLRSSRAWGEREARRSRARGLGARQRDWGRDGDLQVIAACG